MRGFKSASISEIEHAFNASNFSFQISKTDGGYYNCQILQVFVPLETPAQADQYNCHVNSTDLGNRLVESGSDLQV